MECCLQLLDMSYRVMSDFILDLEALHYLNEVVCLSNYAEHDLIELGGPRLHSKSAGEYVIAPLSCFWRQPVTNLGKLFGWVCNGAHLLPILGSS